MDTETIAGMRFALEKQKAAFAETPWPAAQERIDALMKLKRMLLDNIDPVCEAISKDFDGGRSRDDTKLAELMASVEGIKYTTRRISKWMRPVKRRVGPPLRPGKAWVAYQPVGAVGVIVPWNYPLYLAVGPLTTALAAGNRVMLKMSEYTPHFGQLFAELIAATFPVEQIAVVNGEVGVAQAFAGLPFDHLLFTGSTSIGRQVMRAAADNLTPVTLELGGKSPCIIGEDDVDMKATVPRICFGKCLNAGQTCVAPDYILCPAGRVDEFVDAWEQQIGAMYPSLKDNPDLTSIANERQYLRLQSCLNDAREKGATVIEVNPQNEDLSGSRKMPFSIVLNVTDDMTIMQEEIFGPMLPVVPYERLEQAIDYINERPRPLGLYYMGSSEQDVDRILHETHSGGVCINDTALHVAVEDLPFGGVGDSGIGRYHGREGFLRFSNEKGVYKRGRVYAFKVALPPYGRVMQKLMYKFFLR